jgi:protein-disulfide isomerase
MNQIEIWFSILVRKALKRGNFISLNDLKAKVRFARLQALMRQFIKIGSDKFTFRQTLSQKGYKNQMAKRIKNRTTASKKQERKTNWIVIGSIIGVGVIALFGLLFFSLQSAGAPTPIPTPARTLALQDHCEANPENCVITGAPDAPVTIVEVSDYGCSHCKNFNLDTADTLKQQYVDSGVVRWITLPYALGGQSGFPTAPSANAAMCVSEQGQDAFEKYHQALFTIQGTPAFNTPAGFIAIANDLGLDSEALSTCVEDGRYNNAIQRNIQVATSAGVNSTPSFFVNGELVNGNLPLANFQQIINTEAGS